MRKLIFIIMLMNISCSEKEQKVKLGESSSESYFKEFNNEDLRRELSQKVFSVGDTTAYKKLWDMYFYSGHSNDFLRIAMVMSNDFNYPQAYHDTYTILKTDVINKVNLKSNRLANYYLLKAYELKFDGLESTVKNRFSDYKTIPSSDSYFQEICGNVSD